MILEETGTDVNITLVGQFVMRDLIWFHKRLKEKYSPTFKER